MQVFDVLMELPEIMYTEIGRIAAAHSYLEYALSLIVQDQLRLGCVDKIDSQIT